MVYDTQNFWVFGLCPPMDKGHKKKSQLITVVHKFNVGIPNVHSLIYCPLPINAPSQIIILHSQ
jgi:hypothetical protein